eukprot:3455756-Rhodomonas_salina.1
MGHLEDGTDHGESLWALLGEVLVAGSMIAFTTAESRCIAAALVMEGGVQRKVKRKLGVNAEVSELVVNFAVRDALNV